MSKHIYKDTFNRLNLSKKVQSFYFVLAKPLKKSTLCYHMRPLRDKAVLPRIESVVFF